MRRRDGSSRPTYRAARAAGKGRLTADVRPEMAARWGITPYQLARRIPTNEKGGR